MLLNERGVTVQFKDDKQILFADHEGKPFENAEDFANKFCGKENMHIWTGKFAIPKKLDINTGESFDVQDGILTYKAKPYVLFDVDAYEDGNHIASTDLNIKYHHTTDTTYKDATTFFDKNFINFKRHLQ